MRGVTRCSPAQPLAMRRIGDILVIACAAVYVLSEHVPDTCSASSGSCADGATPPLTNRLSLSPNSAPLHAPGQPGFSVPPNSPRATGWPAPNVDVSPYDALDFGRRPLCMPAVEDVELINLSERDDLHVHSVRVVYCDDPGACFTYDGDEVTANFKRNEVRRQPELLQPPCNRTLTPAHPAPPYGSRPTSSTRASSRRRASRRARASRSPSSSSRASSARPRRTSPSRRRRAASSTRCAPSPSPTRTASPRSRRRCRRARRTRRRSRCATRTPRRSSSRRSTPPKSFCSSTSPPAPPPRPAPTPPPPPPRARSCGTWARTRRRRWCASTSPPPSPGSTSATSTSTPTLRA